MGGSSEGVRLVGKIWGREPGRAGRQAGCAMWLAGRGQDARYVEMVSRLGSLGGRRASQLSPWRSVRGRGRAFTSWRN